MASTPENYFNFGTVKQQPIQASQFYRPIDPAQYLQQPLPSLQQQAVRQSITPMTGQAELGVEGGSGISGDDYYSRLAQIESGGNTNAYNSSGHAGKYQFSKSTAQPYINQLGSTWEEFRKDPIIQEQVEKKWTADLDNILKRNGFATSGFNRWVLHNQGPGGGLYLLRGQYDKVNPKNIAANLPGGGTAQDYMSYWRKKWQ